MCSARSTSEAVFIFRIFEYLVCLSSPNFEFDALIADWRATTLCSIIYYYVRNRSKIFSRGAQPPGGVADVHVHM